MSMLGYNLESESISAEVLPLLEENIPTAEELTRREEFLQCARRMRATPSPASGPFPSSEELQREDRLR